jgi:vacuolar-type H+-ATPase subunit H
MIHSPQSDYAQNQDIESLLERLESLVISARSVPFSDNCMVDREEMLVLITMIRDELPGELKQAKWLLEQNRQLIAEARKEAETIMRDAEARMSRMIDEHEITQKARLQASDLLEKIQPGRPENPCGLDGLCQETPRRDRGPARCHARHGPAQ